VAEQRAGSNGSACRTLGFAAVTGDRLARCCCLRRRLRSERGKGCCSYCLGAEAACRVGGQPVSERSLGSPTPLKRYSGPSRGFPSRPRAFAECCNEPRTLMSLRANTVRCSQLSIRRRSGRGAQPQRKSLWCSAFGRQGDSAGSVWSGQGCGSSLRGLLFEVRSDARAESRIASRVGSTGAIMRGSLRGQSCECSSEGRGEALLPTVPVGTAERLRRLPACRSRGPA